MCDLVNQGFTVYIRTVSVILAFLSKIAHKCYLSAVRVYNEFFILYNKRKHVEIRCRRMRIRMTLVRRSDRRWVEIRSV